MRCKLIAFFVASVSLPLGVLHTSIFDPRRKNEMRRLPVRPSRTLPCTSDASAHLLYSLTSLPALFPFPQHKISVSLLTARSLSLSPPVDLFLSFPATRSLPLSATRSHFLSSPLDPFFSPSWQTSFFPLTARYLCPFSPLDLLVPLTARSLFLSSPLDLFLPVRRRISLTLPRH